MVNTVIINGIIHEYDIAKAGYSAIKSYISKDLAKKLDAMPKRDRNIQIGLMMRQDNAINDKVTKGIFNARQRFIDDNKLNGILLELTKDSVTIRSKIPRIIKIGDFKFRANSYTSYIKFKTQHRNISLYYNSLEDSLRFKGIKHNEDDAFVVFIKDMISSLENDVSDSNKVLKTLRYYKRIFQTLPGNTRYKPDIYKSIIKGNKFIYNLDNDDIMESDSYIEKYNDKIDKYDNYEIFINLLKVILQKYNI